MTDANADTEKRLPLPARVYIGATLILGVVACVHGAATFHSEIPARFLWYLLISLVSAGLKVSLPGINGTLSVNFLFIILGIAELSLGETILLSSACALLQSVWIAKRRPQAVQVLFSIFSQASAVYLAYLFFHSQVAIYISSGGQILMVLPVAASIYFVANTLPVANIIALSEHKRFAKVWKEYYFWFLPYYLVGATIVCLLHWVNVTVGWQFSFLVLPVFYMMYRSYSSYLGRLEGEKKHVEEVSKLHLRTIQALALAIEAKDQTTHDHLKRVQIYVVELAKDLGLGEGEIEALRAAAVLHDIGKLAVPEHIISKPGKLTAEEFEKMKIHPTVGAEILEQVEFPYPVAPIVKAHHEKWDGSGYPDGLKGEEIPIGARILSVVDCLDALTSHRQYRRAVSLEDAMKIVVGDSGKAFDPQVVKVLQRRYLDLDKMVQESPSNRKKLVTDIKVERGIAPAAGFETTHEPVEAPKTELSFLSRIADARQEAQMLFELVQELGNSLSLKETLSLLATRLQPMVPYDAIAMYECRGELLIPIHVAGLDAQLFASLEIPIGEGLSGWVAHNQKPIINGNPAVEPGYLGDASKFSRLRSALSVPLEGVSGVIGVLTLYRVQNDGFSKDNLRILGAVTTKIALSLENALRHRQLENSATTDFLTGLMNARSLFVALDTQIARSERTRSSLTLLVCDLDGFRQINDRFGHLEGNRMLQEFAQRLRNELRQSDFVARMGGDEFVMVLPELDAQGVARIVERLNRVAVEVGQWVCGADLMSVSIGASQYPEDGKDAEALLTQADRRMYTAKRNRKAKTSELRRTVAESSQEVRQPIIQ